MKIPSNFLAKASAASESLLTLDCTITSRVPQDSIYGRVSSAGSSITVKCSVSKDDASEGASDSAYANTEIIRVFLPVSAEIDGSASVEIAGKSYEVIEVLSQIDTTDLVKVVRCKRVS